MSGAFTYGTEPWVEALVPASFRSIFFYVERVSESSGRRIALHEYPLRDTPFAEDMGKRARRWTVSAYVIGPSYTAARDLLVTACLAPGSAQLTLPTQGAFTVVCEQITETETREKGGIATFEMTFVEAGSPTVISSVVPNTAVQATTSANNLLTATQTSMTAAFVSI